MKSVLLVCHLDPRKLGTFEHYLAAAAAHGRAAGVRVGALLAGEPVPEVAAAFTSARLEWWAEPDWAPDEAAGGPAFRRGLSRALAAGPWDVAVFQFCRELAVVRGLLAARLRGTAPRSAVWVQHSQMATPGRAARLASRLRLLRPAVHEMIVLADGAKAAAVGRGWPAGRVTVVRNGIPAVDPRTPRHAVRAALGVPAAARVLLAVGSLIPRKGFDVLLDAVAPVLRQSSGPESLPAIAGGLGPTILLVAGDGPDRAALEHRAATLGVTDAVRWLGLRADVPDLLGAADVFVLASRAEGLTLAVVEALAAGVPAVVTDVGGHQEVVTPDLGAVVPAGDPAAFRAAVAAVLADLPAAAARSAAAKDRVRAAFSLDTQVARQFELFRRAAGGEA